MKENISIRQSIKEDRESYIMELGKIDGKKLNQSLEQRNIGLDIYNTMKFPGAKPLRYHLYDQKKHLTFSSERNLGVLKDDKVVEVLEFFVENIENSMKANYKEYRFTDYDSHVSRESAVDKKKSYILALINSLQQRKSIKSPGDELIIMNEKLYEHLLKLSNLSNEKKLICLKEICDFLPDHARVTRPDSNDINQIFK